LAKKINVIPVYRAEDAKIQGKGQIIMTSETDIQGFGTKFISEIKNNKNFNLGIHSLLIKKKLKLMVEKVIDEEHIKVYMTGLGFIMTRINVVPQNKFINSEVKNEQNK
jgi:hypothetical protein